MIRVKVIDLKQFDFKCLRCGNCCYNVLRKIECNDHFFDYKGHLTENPTISVTVTCWEKQEIERALTLTKSNGIQLFYPFEALYAKGHQVGFVHAYQIKVKKDKYCAFYDAKNRSCKIYPLRPSTCRCYPLTRDPFNSSKIALEGSCSGLNEQILMQYPGLKEYEPVYLDDIAKDLPSVFPEEYFLYVSTKNFLISHMSLFFYFIGDSFRHDLTIDQIKDYKLMDLSEFFAWAEKHLEESDLVRLKLLKRYAIDSIALFKKDPRKFKECFNQATQLLTSGYKIKA